MKYKALFGYAALFFIAFFSLGVAAQGDEDQDISVDGLELEKILNLGSGVMAARLFFLTRAAYARTRNRRLHYVSLAFVFFAFKGFLTSSELFFTELSWVDPTASVLDFAILLIFFFGIIKG